MTTHNLDYLKEWLDEDEIAADEPSLITFDDINIALQNREMEYPYRGPGYQKMMSIISSWFDQLAADIDLTIPKDVPSVSQITDNPVFIFGNMKSGTSLMIQLLDNHPDLLAVPVESFNMSYNEGPAATQVLIKDICKTWITKLITPTGQSPFWLLGKDLQIYSDFVIHLFSLLNNESTLDTFKILECVINSISSITNCQHSVPIRFVEKTPENERYVKELHAQYPNAKFIHMIRDPMSNLASMKKLAASRNEEFNITHRISAIGHGLTLALKNREKFKNDRYLHVRYEDLVGNLDNEIKKITKFLDISYEESLLKPSILGLHAVSNSMYDDQRISGKVIDAQKLDSRIERVKNDLNFHEFMQAKAAFTKIANLFNYSVENYGEYLNE